MSTVTQKIQDLVAQFVQDVTALANQAALDTLQGAFGGTGVTTTSSTRTPRETVASKKNRGNGQGGAKRSPEQLAALREKLLGHIKANPGQRVEEINVALGTTTGELSRPIHALIADGEVRSEGRLRSTRYYPGSKAKAAPKAKTKAAKKTSAPKKAAKPKKDKPAKAPKAAKRDKPAKSEAADGEGASTQALDKETLEKALADSKGNITAAAKELGRSPSALRRAIKKHGLTVKG